MGIFDNIQTAEMPGNRGNFAMPGHYIARIESVKSGIARESRKDYVLIGMLVLKVYDDDEGKGHRVGQDVVHFIMQGDLFLGNVKAFVSVVAECDPDEVTKEICEQVCSEDQPFQGYVVEWKGKMHRTKKGQNFTIVNYLRRVPASELSSSLSPEVIQVHFRDNLLERMIEAEEAAV